MSEQRKPVSATEAIDSYIKHLDPGAIVLRFVVVAEVLDNESERSIWVSVAEDAKPWDTLGLLQYATGSVLDE